MENKYPTEECLGNSLKEGDAKLYNHRQFEMTRIDDPHSDKLPDKVKIFVCGENNVQDMMTPHFHIIGRNFEFEVNIKHIYQLDILKTIRIDDWSNAGTWNEKENILDAVLKWLDEPNSELVPMTNAATILAQWNMNNPNHKVPQSWKE